MEWVPNLKLLQDIIALLRQADSNDSEVQRHLAEAIGSLEFLVDTPCYYCYILTKAHQEHIDVRQRAGLLLKASIARLVLALHTDKKDSNAVEAQTLNYIQSHVTKALLDPNHEIRATAGSIITTLVARQGIESLPELLPFLTSLLDHADPEIVNAAYDAFNKIIEDEMDRLTSVLAMNSTQRQKRELNVVGPNELSELGGKNMFTFYKFCLDQLIDKLFNVIKSNSNLSHRCKALSSLNKFQQRFLFSPNNVFADHFTVYWEALGIMANEADPEVRILVLSGILRLSIPNPEFFHAQLDNLLPFIITCLDPSTQTYDVRLQCLELMIFLFRTEQARHLSTDVLKKALPLLLENTRYSKWDFMQMDQNQFVDDNALVPDTAEDIAPVLAGSFRRQDDQYRDTRHSGFDDEEGFESESSLNNLSTWGSKWTVRKVAAMLLDHCSTIFGNAILPFLLPLIEQKLQSEDWEIAESAILALGAIAQGCIDGLNPYLPKILDVIIRMCNARRPILRTISLWTLSRFSLWICPQPDVLALTCQVILSHVLDSSKRVQEAACSAFAAFEENAGKLLVPHLPTIINTFSVALKTFQTKNKFVLLDAIGTLADSLGAEIDTPQFHNDIIVPLINQWNAAGKNDSLFILLFECINGLVATLRKNMSRYIPVLTVRCLSYLSEVIDSVQADQSFTPCAEDFSFHKAGCEAAECSFDLLSTLCETDPEQTKELLERHDLVSILVKYCQVPLHLMGPSVKRGCFALIGDLASHNPSWLLFHLDKLVPHMIQFIADTPLAVSHNASWAIGSIAVNIAHHGELNPYAEQITEKLTEVITSPSTCEELVRNSCFTLARIAAVCPQQVCRRINSVLGYWCMVLAGCPNSNEKILAMRGICALIEVDQQLALDHTRVLLEMIASLYLDENGQIDIERFHENSPSRTHQMVCKLIQWLKLETGARWPSLLAEHTPATQMIIRELSKA